MKNECVYKEMMINTAMIEIPRETYQRPLSPEKV